VTAVTVGWMHRRQEMFEERRRLQEGAWPAAASAGCEKRETAKGRTALAVDPNQRLMPASGRLHEPVLHGVEDQVESLTDLELSVDRGQVVAHRMLAEV
jgi:hypothetical protein